MGISREAREDFLGDIHERFDLVPVNELQTEEEYKLNNTKMNNKLSKVKNVQGSGTWENNGTLFYKFEYEMEDGQIVNAMHKSQEPRFKVGEEVEYLITNAQYNNGKINKPQQGGFSGGSSGGKGFNDPKKQSSIIAQSCIKAACDLYSGLNKDPKEVIEAADLFFTWVNTK